MRPPHCQDGPGESGRIPPPTPDLASWSDLVESGGSALFGSNQGNSVAGTDLAGRAGVLHSRSLSYPESVGSLSSSGELRMGRTRDSFSSIPRNVVGVVRGRMSGARTDKAADATTQEKVILAQIKELTRQLNQEKHRKKEQARASHYDKKQRRRLIVCSQQLPYRLEVTEDGSFEIGRATSKLKSYESLHDRLDVAWVGCPPMDVPEEHQEEVRRRYNDLNCHPVFVSPEQLELAEGMWAEVLWPLFHYIPLSMLESDTEMIHQRWRAYESLNQAFALVRRTHQSSCTRDVPREGCMARLHCAVNNAPPTPADRQHRHRRHRFSPRP